MTTNSPDPVEWFDDVDRAAPKKPPERMAWVKGNKVREWIMLSPDDAATFQHPDGGRIVDEAKGRTLPFESFEDAADGEARRLALQVEAAGIGADKIRQDRDALAAVPKGDRTTEQRMLLRLQRQVLRLSRITAGLADDAGDDE